MMKNLLLAMILVFSCSLAFAEGYDNAHIISVKGDVKAQVGFIKLWKEAKAEQLLTVGDLVKTGADGYCEIALSADEKDIFKVEPNSTVKLEVFDGKNKIINLSLGKVYGYVADLNRNTNFEVRTPTATAGARGTSWSVWTDGLNNDFCTYERNIYVRSYDQRGKLIKEVTVGQGFKVYVAAHQPPGAFAQVPVADMNYFNSWRGDFMNRIPYFKNLGPGGRGPAIKTPDQYRQQGQEQFESYKNRYNYGQGGGYYGDQRRRFGY